jgi:tetratricopeptide (TPR) repeat protein
LNFEALVAELRNADTDALVDAVSAAANLRDLEPCRDAALLERLPSPPVEVRDDAPAVRAELARVAALWATGAYEEGLAAARESLEHAQELGWAPLVAAARLHEGTLLYKLGKYEDAEVVLEAAYFEAAGSGATEEAFGAARELAQTVGHRLVRIAEGERWWKLAEVERSRLSDPTGLREAQSLNTRANLHAKTGAYAEAAELYERALALDEEALGPEHPTVAVVLQNLARQRHEMGAVDEATALYLRVLDLRERVLGPDHPDVAGTLYHLGAVRREAGDLEEAARLLERALALPTMRPRCFGARSRSGRRRWATRTRTWPAACTISRASS